MRTPKIGQHWGPSPWDGAQLTPKIKPPPHICYHVKFGGSTGDVLYLTLEIGVVKHLCMFIHTLTQARATELGSEVDFVLIR